MRTKALIFLFALFLAGCSLLPSAILQIESDPNGSTIYLNDRPLGETPGVHRVRPGSHQVRWVKDGYVTHEETVTLLPGQEKLITADLLAIGPVTLTVTTDPEDVRVYFNGEFKGMTPITLVTQQGDHLLRLEMADHRTIEEAFILQGNSYLALSYTLVPVEYGFLQVTTEPLAETIRIISPFTQSLAPGQTLALEPGTYRLELRRTGYNTANADLVVEAGKTVRLHSPLLPLRHRDQEPIQGPPLLTARQMADYLESVLHSRGEQAKINTGSILELAEYYIKWGLALNIRGDVVFAQSIHETGYFQFRGDVVPEQNNFGGIGTTGGGVRGAYFETPEIGVLAQTQHLYGYSTTQPLPAGMTIHTPRWHLISKGSAPRWSGLTGRYATDPQYHIKVWDHYTKMRNHAGL